MNLNRAAQSSWERRGSVLWLTLGLLAAARATPGTRLATLAGTLGLGVLALSGSRWSRARPAAGTLILAGVTLTATVVAGLAAATPEGLTRARSGVITYGNARAALYVLGGGAALALALRAGPGIARRLSLLGGGLLLLLPFAVGAHAAAAGSVIVASGATLARPGRGRTLLVGAGALLATALTVSIALGVNQEAGRKPPLPPVLLDELTERRLQLWADALVQAREHPISGIGLGQFANESPVAQSDADAGWAHHEPLQFAAEAGIPAAALAIAVTWWLFVGLGQQRDDRGQQVLVLTVAALGVNAHVDYVLHTPLVLLAGVAVASVRASPVQAVPE